MLRTIDKVLPIIASVALANARAMGQENGTQAPVISSKPAENPYGLTLVVRGPTNVVKVGDEIPIEFIISNHGTASFNYCDPMPQLFDMGEVELIAKTTTGQTVPKPTLPDWPMQISRSVHVLHPGESFSKIIPLNLGH